MINAGQVVAHMTLDTSQFTNGINTALSEMRSFTDNTINASQRITGLGQGLMSIGGMLSATVSAPLLGVATASAKVASDFEAGMSKVQAISGATSSDIERLSEKAKEMGANTKFSASESAEAFQYMSMAGWKTEEMLNGISGIMDLAAASGENLGLVSDIVTDAITAFGLSASDSAHFADVLASASSNANTNVSMLGKQFAQLKVA